MPAKTRLSPRQKKVLDSVVTDLWGMSNGYLSTETENINSLFEALSIAFDLEPNKSFFSGSRLNKSSPIGEDKGDCHEPAIS